MGGKLNFLDLFAGAGGLSEGFIRAGFSPVSHVEMDRSACLTIKTRMAYHWLKAHDRLDCYVDYLNRKISRTEFYNLIPPRLMESVINIEIRDNSMDEIFNIIDALLEGKPLNLIIGGPPCQAYSIVGRSRDSNRMMGDKRNYLYTYYAEFLKRYVPEYFVFENVTGLLSAKGQDGVRYIDKMLSLFRETGYETEFRVLSSEKYGVPQNRQRIILVGKKGRETAFYPEPDRWHPGIDVIEVLQDLPAIRSGEGSVAPCYLEKYSGHYLYDAGIRNDGIPVTWHQARQHTEQDLEIYRITVERWNNHGELLNYNDLPERLKTHKNRSSFVNRFRVVCGNKPFSHTIVAHIAKDGHYYIHPDIGQNRSLTPREAARLQTFPDDYFFENVSEVAGYSSPFRQIGNAVPVLLAHKIAKKLMEKW
ncbi:MAG: DNA cytosine methyltransferase [Nitrospirae bacterium]|nr:DNA cytosine methyltransferase [Nitrospirota bacterium]